MSFASGLPLSDRERRQEPRRSVSGALAALRRAQQQRRYGKQATAESKAIDRRIMGEREDEQ
jgi:hypothetical protein